MALNKLRALDEHSAGITMPKDDLRLEGLIDENGDLTDDDHHVHIRHEGDGQWTLELVDEIEI